MHNSIVVGSLFVKVPQILKILSNKSGAGINMFSVFLELTAITLNLSYNFVKGKGKHSLFLCGKENLLKLCGLLRFPIQFMGRCFIFGCSNCSDCCIGNKLQWFIGWCSCVFGNLHSGCIYTHGRDHTNRCALVIASIKHSNFNHW